MIIQTWPLGMSYMTRGMLWSVAWTQSCQEYDHICSMHDRLWPEAWTICDQQHDQIWSAWLYLISLIISDQHDHIWSVEWSHIASCMIISAKWRIIFDWCHNHNLSSSMIIADQWHDIWSEAWYDQWHDHMSSGVWSCPISFMIIHIRSAAWSYLIIGIDLIWSEARSYLIRGMIIPNHAWHTIRSRLIKIRWSSQNTLMPKRWQKAKITRISNCMHGHKQPPSTALIQVHYFSISLFQKLKIS